MGYGCIFEPTLDVKCFWLAVVSFLYECMFCGKSSWAEFAQVPPLAEVTVVTEALGHI